MKYIALLLAAACGSSPPPEHFTELSPPPQKDRLLRSPPHEETETRQFISQGRPSGTLTYVTRSDHTVDIKLDIVENGRGPHVEAKMTLGDDGTPISWHAIGNHTFGVAIDETFTRTGARGMWRSHEESSGGDATGPTFWISNAELSLEPWLVPAALKNGGSIALWPSGEAHVKKVAEVAVDGRTLVGYEITGFGLGPDYTWFDTDGKWFGTASPFEAFVPAGWDKAIAPLSAKRSELRRARSAEIAKAAIHHPPAAGLAYTHARVLDVETGKWLSDQTVLITGDTIKAVGPRVWIPKEAETVDLAGKALIPGLVDMHSHQSENEAVLDVASGVTTARDVGNDPDELDDMKARFDAGTAVGPHEVRMGFIEGRGDKAASSKITAETKDEAVAGVAEYARRGYDGMKIYNSMKVELVPVITAEAHKRGMLVTGHIPVHMLAREAVEAGYDGIEHINMLFLNFLADHDTDTRDTTRFTLVGDRGTEVDLEGKPFKDFVALLLAHHTVIDPTLGAFEDLFAGEPGLITPGIEDLVARLPPQEAREYLLGGLPLPGNRHEQFLRSWKRIFEMVKALYDAKVTLVVGTDTIAGLGLHHEMKLLARCGIPNAAILKMATVDSARAMKMDKTFGAIAAGKRADVVVIDGDPVANLADLRKVVWTVRGGVVYDPKVLFAAVSVKP